ncbi:hypothetical protein [Aliagarivorans taiwanensis]|uniref:hypothetical protein n=1 Tax=Aliagarivorans taiwanensis TaxID=561966 RepID=UPI00047C7986|nr:hypothetical protein [Aliagarivorans taiwanensis]
MAISLDSRRNAIAKAVQLKPFYISKVIVGDRSEKQAIAGSKKHAALSLLNIDGAFGVTTVTIDGERFSLLKNLPVILAFAGKTEGSGIRAIWVLLVNTCFTLCLAPFARGLFSGCLLYPSKLKMRV